jgi:hypothetical protein
VPLRQRHMHAAIWCVWHSLLPPQLPLLSKLAAAGAAAAVVALTCPTLPAPLPLTGPLLHHAGKSYDELSGEMGGGGGGCHSST